MHTKTLAELSAGLAAGEFSSTELTRALLDRIDALDRQDDDSGRPGLNAFITVTAEQALQQAAEADRLRAVGQAGPLTGLPIAHKDIFCTDGVLTSCGSRMLHNFIAPYDAAVVSRCREAGLISLGKTNMDEFAMGSSNETSWYGPVRNPWDTERVPGGSSGGSAAAVAAGQVAGPPPPGTDTGGSIRQPAALCGITGLKPTYGRVSRWGMIAFASSLDQGGVMASSAEDLALLMQVIAGLDPRDSTSVDTAVPDYRAGLQDSLQGLRIGLPTEFFDQRLDPAVAALVRDAVRELEAAGAVVKEVSLPSSAQAVPTYYVVAPAECSSNLSRFDGVRFGYRAENPADLEDLYKRSRGEGFGPEVKRRIMVGTYALSAGYYDAYYLKAQQVRRLIADDYRAAFEQVDLIASPTTPTPAFRLGDKTDDPVEMYLSDIYTISANLAGLPGISMPAGFQQGLPIGLQLVGNYFTEGRLLNVAHRYQQLTDWHRRRPTGI